MDLIPSLNVQIIRRFVEASFSKIRERFEDYKAISRKRVQDLKDANSYGTLRTMV